MWERKEYGYEWKKWEGCKIVQGVRHIFPLKGREYAELYQIHSSLVRVVDKPVKVVGDGLVTSVPGLPLVVKTADCYPVFLYDSDKRICGIYHAGWRGTLLEIGREAVRVMKEVFDCLPSSIWVLLGAGIGKESYTVGKEVYELFLKKFPEAVEERNGRYYVDLYLANRISLEKEGVKEIIPPRWDTFIHEEFYSKRRGDTERNIAWIELLT